MKLTPTTRLTILAAALACGFPTLAQPPAPKPADLPVRAITLYRSGVGSFERRGQIDGNSTVQLRFNTDQINDILKSMIILDLSKNGRIDGVSYGSRDPLAKRLSSFGVDISDEPSLGTILARLRGAKVTVTMPEGPWTGTILGGEVRMESRVNNTPPVAVPYLNIVTAAGIKSLNLTQALTTELLDKDLAAELQRALTAVAEHRADRTKTVDITLSGEGAREIVVAYVQEAPVWKASYRLVLPDEPKGGAKEGDQLTLHGWAIVENTTDEDWNSVTLSLVSGRPVSFRMDLYQPLYVFRPEVPVPTVPGVAPRIFEAGTEGESKDRGEVERGRRSYAGVPGSPPAAAAPAPMDKAKSLQDAASTGQWAEVARVSSAQMGEYAAASQARAVESGEIFEYELDHPVTVERQRSAMLPIISAGVTGRRVSILNPKDGSEYPMRGIEVTNSTGLQLLPGPISVYDHGAYAGDAQIGHVPAGDKRLLAYSVDLAMKWDEKIAASEDIRRVRIVRGLLEATTLHRVTNSYALINKDADRPRTVIVEFPQSVGWDLKVPEKPYETTPDLYRFLVDVPKAGKGALEIVQERTEATTYQLTGLDMSRLMEFGKRGGKVSQAVIDAFKEAQRRQGLVLEAGRRIAELEKERAGIDADQTRIRNNMGTIDKTSDLYRRYMQKLAEQETRVETLAGELEKARQDQTRLVRELEAYIEGLNVE